MVPKSAAKVRQNRYIFQITCIIQKIPLLLQQRQKITPARSFEKVSWQKNILQPMAYTLDETDLKLLRTLQKNAKLTTKELAEAVNLTPTPVFERQKRLEREGYIHRYVAVLDADRLGQSLQVFCKVKLKQINHEIAASFERRIMRIAEVTECYNTSGAYDYLLKVRARDMAQYHEFVLSKLGDIEHVAAIESTFVMSEVKQTYGINV